MWMLSALSLVRPQLRLLNTLVSHVSNPVWKLVNHVNAVMLQLHLQSVCAPAAHSAGPRSASEPETRQHSQKVCSLQRQRWQARMPCSLRARMRASWVS